jgi:hypothetical protein
MFDVVAIGMPFNNNSKGAVPDVVKSLPFKSILPITVTVLVLTFTELIVLNRAVLPVIVLVLRTIELSVLNIAVLPVIVLVTSVENVLMEPGPELPAVA